MYDIFNIFNKYQPHLVGRGFLQITELLKIGLSYLKKIKILRQLKGTVNVILIDPPCIGLACPIRNPYLINNASDIFICDKGLNLSVVYLQQKSASHSQEESK